MKPNDRIICIGSTGSGKTTLAGYMTLRVQRLAVYDVKRELDWLPDSVVVTDLALMTYARREVFQPPVGMEADRELFERFCAGAYQAGNVLIWIDEAAFVTSPSYLPPSLESVLVAGRSRGVGCIALTQSGAGLSNPMLWRAAEHVYVGYSNDRAVESLIPYLGTEVMPATEIKQYSGAFLAFISNAKTPSVQQPIDTNKLGPNYVRQH